jgi:hypothetical protein
MADLRDFLQGMSNSAASNVSAPVDGLAWLLRKAGLPIPSNPVGGSDWMAQKGLIAQPQNKNMGLLGEAIGGVLPMLAAAKAPQIAGGLLQAGENLAAPRNMHSQAGVIASPFGRYGASSTEVMDDLAKERLSRVQGMDDSYRLPNLHNAVPKEYLPKQHGSQMVTVYRGVPSSVKDPSIRPGDWVGLDPKYALQHGTGETGKSKLLKMEVPADHVGWAGTDMNEFFYVPRDITK